MTDLDITILLRAADGFDLDSNLRADAADLIDKLREALLLADAALSEANMNMKVVQEKVRAALKEGGQ
jgi:hypothetical protein